MGVGAWGWEGGGGGMGTGKHTQNLAHTVPLVTVLWSRSLQFDPGGKIARKRRKRIKV